jgi:hypothetical protein
MPLINFRSADCGGAYAALGSRPVINGDTSMRRLALVCTLLAASAIPAFAAEVGGNYTVEGTNFDGAPYGGTATITVSSNSTCEIAWQTGQSESVGICMLLNDSFAAGYVMGDAVGLVIYEVQEDGVLNGVWTAAGVDGAGTEILTPAQ